MANKPGMMVYFDMIPAFENMTDEERGKFFLAMLHYSQSGVVPALDEKLGMAWMFMMPKLDCDTERYEKTVQSRKYAAYCRFSKQRGIAPMPFEDWLLNSLRAEEAALCATTEGN